METIRTNQVFKLSLLAVDMSDMSDPSIMFLFASVWLLYYLLQLLWLGIQAFVFAVVLAVLFQGLVHCIGFFLAICHRTTRSFRFTLPRGQSGAAAA